MKKNSKGKAMRMAFWGLAILGWFFFNVLVGVYIPPLVRGDIKLFEIQEEYHNIWGNWSQSNSLYPGKTYEFAWPDDRRIMFTRMVIKKEIYACLYILDYKLSSKCIKTGEVE